ncbi:MAG TPA: ion channel [Ktedonobacterales bacterium]|nr:ion channel [Ktedonobacterales bacterium]
MLLLQMVATLAAVLLIALVLWEAFETVVLPRRVSRRFRLTRVYFRVTWRAWSAVARRVPSPERRELTLAIFGPLALLGLLAFWVILLIVAYALLLWGLGSPLTDAATHAPDFGSDLYFSGTTLLTLGLGDVAPHSGLARAVAVIEVGTGFALLALVIGYLPVLYQAFSRREQRISLLDAHAGSPPTAGALLLRHPPDRRARRLTRLLEEWESWAAELLETHLSYPVLAYYRSQHEDQSWATALAVILDACALVLACGSDLLGEEELIEQAAFTFAMARHAAVDLAQFFHTPRTRLNAHDGRLPPDQRARLRDVLVRIGLAPDMGGTIEVTRTSTRLDELRALYEPYLEGLAAYQLMALPPWVPAPEALDDWQTTADNLTAPSITALVAHQRSRRPDRVVHTGRPAPPADHP